MYCPANCRALSSNNGSFSRSATRLRDVLKLAFVFPLCHHIAPAHVRPMIGLLHLCRIDSVQFARLLVWLKHGSRLWLRIVRATYGPWQAALRAEERAPADNRRRHACHYNFAADPPTLKLRRGKHSRLYPPSSQSWDYGVASSNHSCIVTGL